MPVYIRQDGTLTGDIPGDTANYIRKGFRLYVAPVPVEPVVAEEPVVAAEPAGAEPRSEWWQKKERPARKAKANAEEKDT